MAAFDPARNDRRDLLPMEGIAEDLEMTQESIDHRKIADDHWEFVKGLICAAYAGIELDLSLVDFAYKSAFLHGWKHAKDDKCN